MKSYGYHRTSTREQHLDRGINWFKYVYFYDNRNYRNNRNYVRKNVCNERKNYKCFCKGKINLMNRNERMHLPMGNIDTPVPGVPDVVLHGRDSSFPSRTASVSVSPR